jgi:hypothetical protein
MKWSFFILVAILFAGCAERKLQEYEYFNRPSVRIAVMPAQTKSSTPESTIIFDKACEEALKKKGFEVIPADAVVTYAASRGLAIRELSAVPSNELGKDLKADFLLFTDIRKWEQNYAVIHSAATVSGVTEVVECSTAALLCRRGWYAQESSGGGGSILGVLANAAASAIIQSATDVCASLGERCATSVAADLPQPGSAPKRSQK